MERKKLIDGGLYNYGNNVVQYESRNNIYAIEDLRPIPLDLVHLERQGFHVDKRTARLEVGKALVCVQDYRKVYAGGTIEISITNGMSTYERTGNDICLDDVQRAMIEMGVQWDFNVHLHMNLPPEA